MSELRSAAGETVTYEIGPVEREEPLLEIASSSGASITTTANHGYSTNDHVRVTGHVWNPINGRWIVASVQSPTQFTLSGAPSGMTGGATGYVNRVAAVDLSAADTMMRFSAKESLDAVSAYVAKDSDAGAGLGGITLNDPSTARKNLATLTIDPADTSALDESTDFYFDVWLEEPDGRMTRIDRGIWKIGAAVTSA